MSDGLSYECTVTGWGVQGLVTVKILQNSESMCVLNIKNNEFPRLLDLSGMKYKRKKESKSLFLCYWMEDQWKDIGTSSGTRQGLRAQ